MTAHGDTVARLRVLLSRRAMTTHQLADALGLTRQGVHAALTRAGARPCGRVLVGRAWVTRWRLDGPSAVEALGKGPATAGEVALMLGRKISSVRSELAAARRAGTVVATDDSPRVYSLAGGGS